MRVKHSGLSSLMAKYTFHLSKGQLSLPMSLSAVEALVAGIVIAGLKSL